MPAKKMAIPQWENPRFQRLVEEMVSGIIVDRCAGKLDIVEPLLYLTLPRIRHAERVTGHKNFAAQKKRGKNQGHETPVKDGRIPQGYS